MRGSVVELDDEVRLPEGTTVEVVVREQHSHSPSATGSPRAILAALKRPPQCTDENVGVLLREIRQGKSSARFEGVFG